MRERIEVISVAPKHNAKNLSEEKEVTDQWTVVADIPKGGLCPIVVARCYMGRSAQASVVYASIWVHAGNSWPSGQGKAGGYGYCKRSAAMGDAIRSAGIELNLSISGVGTQAIEDALLAIARHYLGDVPMIVV